MILYGSWAVPTKTVNVDPRVQAFWLTIGHFIVSTAIFLALSRQIPSIQDAIAPFIAGIIWSIGINLAYVAIQNLGITRALGVWIPINITVGALWGLIYFKEISSTRGKILIALGVTIALVGALILNYARPIR